MGSIQMGRKTVMSAPRTTLNPDCVTGKHRACHGDAWDFMTDLPSVCACACHPRTETP